MGEYMRKRNKLLLGTIVSCLIMVIIFILFRDKEIYYISLGDSLAIGRTPYNTIDLGYSDYVSEYLKDKEILEFYTKDFSRSDNRSIDIINDIKNNKEITVNNKKLSIKNALVKADLITLSVGTNDLFYKLNYLNSINNPDSDIYDYIDESLYDIEKLLYELRKNCKEQIIVIGFYNPFINYSDSLSINVEPLIVYANSKLEDIVLKYDMTYVDIHNIFASHKDYLEPIYSMYPNQKGYKAISKAIIKAIDNKMLAK